MKFYSAINKIKTIKLMSKKMDRTEKQSIKRSNLG